MRWKTGSARRRVWQDHTLPLMLAATASLALMTGLAATARAAELPLPQPAGWPAPSARTETPGPAFAPPIAAAAAVAKDAPRLFEATSDAGPDETFFVVGAGLGAEVFAWGGSAANPEGQAWPLKVQFSTDGYLAVTLPEHAPDGLFLVWVRNTHGWSRPLRLNAPQPWWCTPDAAAPGETVRIFGRDLARRPDRTTALVYLASSGGKVGRWLEVADCGKYAVSARLPVDVAPGQYELWLHAGQGGRFGWGGPVKLTVSSPRPQAEGGPGVRAVRPPVDLQQLLDKTAQQGGGVVRLDKGVYPLHGTLRVPAGVTLCGAGREATRLQLEFGPAAQFCPTYPDGDRAAVWLSGDGAGLRDLCVSGNPQVNLGVAVRGPKPLAWIKGCRVERVRIADVAGKQAENCGVRLWNAEYAVVRDNEIWARCPLYLSGVRQCRFQGNRLVSRTLWGGNAEAVIQGRNEVIEECVIAGNRVACPPGAEAGGPTARRLIWVSTGRGSITHNWMANNGVEPPSGPGAAVGAGQARFGGVAGTDQNVGEMILFEGNHRTMYFGPLAGADAQGVTLPKTIPPTPEERLGSVKREQLAHDAAGNETPFWPPDDWDEGPEPPIHEYFVSVFRGPGQGQTRRVVRRQGERLILDRPWREPPAAGSVVAVGTAFYQNLIVDNYTADGMTGVQLWISCVENVIAGNSIARQRKPGLFLFGNGTTLASSMPRTWNRGISPLYFNHVEGNRAEECSAGAIVTSGDAPGLPIEFPRALGNVLRHNSFLRSRTDGVVLVSRKGNAAQGDTSPSVLGTILELNVVRDAAVAYHAASGSDAVVFRRNHAYFWYPVNSSLDPPVAFQVDTPKATVAVEQNSVEGTSGTGGGGIVNLKKAEP